MAAGRKKYSAFGLIIESELELPEVCVAPGEPGVRIVFGDVPLELAEPAVRTPWYEAAKGQYLLKVDGIAAYHAANGSVITIQPQPTARPEDIRVFLLSSVFAALLQQRGYLVLHGAAVDVAGKGVVLAGQSGTGKTALTLSLYDKGNGFIADEICAIGCKEGKAFVYPGLPQLSVWQDTLSRENRQRNDYKPIRQGLGKYAVPVDDRFCREPAELSHIVWLTNHNRESIDWHPVKGAAKMEGLMRYLYQPGGSILSADKVSHFQLCIQTGKVASMSRLTFNLQPYQAGNIADFLMKELG